MLRYTCRLGAVNTQLPSAILQETVAVSDVAQAKANEAKCDGNLHCSSVTMGTEVSEPGTTTDASRHL